MSLIERVNALSDIGNLFYTGAMYRKPYMGTSSMGTEKTNELWQRN